MSEKIQPQELIKQAKQAYQSKDYLTAAELFEAASQVFQTQGDDLDAAESGNNASVAYLLGGENEKALALVQPTLPIFEASGDHRRLGMAYGNLAAALEACGRFPEAQQAYQQCADLLQSAGETEQRLNALQALSALQLRTGKQLQAMATMQSALEDLPKPTLKQKFLLKFLRTPWKLLAK